MDFRALPIASDVLAELRPSSFTATKKKWADGAAAKALEWSEAKMWRIETGQTSMRTHDVKLMCEIYAAPPRLVKVLTGLAEATKSTGWWHAYGDTIPEWFDVYVGLEEAASVISEYQSDLVPGLLQTADYYRTMVRGGQMLACSVDTFEIECKLSAEKSKRKVTMRKLLPFRREEFEERFGRLRDLRQPPQVRLRAIQREPVAGHVVDELDLVTSCRHHDPIGSIGAQEVPVLEDLNFDRHGHGNPARHRATLRRRKRHDERGGDARFDRHGLLDRSEIVLDDDVTFGAVGDERRRRFDVRR